VNWRGDSAAVPIASYAIFFRFNNGPWQLWQNFPASQTSARFEYKSLGFGDGSYGFESIAVNTLGQRESQTFTPEATMLVDLADKVHPSAFLPIVSNLTNALASAASQDGQK
jgi:hypothetical protein